MKPKIDKADAKFSQYIRLRDMACVRCGSPVELNDKGLPITHQCSHFWGRRNENTRFDADNADCNCFTCHRYFGENPAAFTEFKREQLGDERFDALALRAHIAKKRDREMEFIRAKELLKNLMEER